MLNTYAYFTLNYLHALFKKTEGDIVIASVRLSVRLSVRPSVCPSVRLSVMLSPPKPLNEIQPNMVCELLR